MNYRENNTRLLQYLIISILISSFIGLTKPSWVCAQWAPFSTRYSYPGSFYGEPGGFYSGYGIYGYGGYGYPENFYGGYSGYGYPGTSYGGIYSGYNNYSGFYGSYGISGYGYPRNFYGGYSGYSYPGNSYSAYPYAYPYIGDGNYSKYVLRDNVLIPRELFEYAFFSSDWDTSQWAQGLINSLF